MVTAQNPRVRRESAPNPANPTHRSNRECVVKNSLVCANSDMVAEEESDKTKTEDEYVPSKSLTPCLFLQSSFVGDVR